jgi:glycosyltransferase involved in cell wall biosynthesis
MEAMNVENRPKISVIVPAYNIEDLIDKCVESLTAQDYPSDLMEIILMDDGSTDSTPQKIDALARRFPNVTAIHKENGGSSSARNVGIEAAKGEFLGFVDSDDFVSEQMYSALVDAALRNKADMVQISRDEIDESGAKLPDVVTPPEKEVVISPKQHMRTLLMHTGDASFCTKLTRRSLFTDDMRFPEGELNEDFYLMIHMLGKVNRLVILPQQYYHVFYRTGSNSRKKAEDKDYFPSVFTDIVRNADVALDLAKNSYPELVKVAERFGYVQRLDYLLHIPISKMTDDNRFYCQVAERIRKDRWKILLNKYLSAKQKAYLWILSINPRFIRKKHAQLRGL